MLSLKFRDQLDGAVADEFDQLIVALKAFLLVAHDEDGTIAAGASITKGVFSGRTVGGIGVSVTTYIGLWDSTTEADSYIIAPVAGVLRNLRVRADGTAGAGQSFTYTVRVNGVDSPVTTSVSGASDITGHDTTRSVSVAAEDVITVKLVTSGAASTRKHQFGLELATA